MRVCGHSSQAVVSTGRALLLSAPPQARLKFPIDYPYSPPAFRFLTKMWHPNIYEVSPPGVPLPASLYWDRGDAALPDESGEWCGH